MNYDKYGIRESYQKIKEQEKNTVDSDTLRELGYSEEDIRNAQIN